MKANHVVPTDHGYTEDIVTEKLKAKIDEILAGYEK